MARETFRREQMQNRVEREQANLDVTNPPTIADSWIQFDCQETFETYLGLDPSAVVDLAAV